MAPADNTLYDLPGDLWWDDHQPFSLLRTALNPARLGYFRQTLERLGVDPHGVATLDVGCGGGLLAEEFARLGCRVTGVDPAEAALAVARSHAAASGLNIAYVAGAGEALPFPDAACGIVLCCDALEHVANPEPVIAEIARVLAPGGVFFFDTINRTILSRLVVVGALQEWAMTRLVPRDVHNWRQFITPDELNGMLRRAGLEAGEMVGLAPSFNPVRALSAIWRYKRGAIAVGEVGRRLPFHVTRDLSMSYAGYALKARTSAAQSANEETTMHDE